MINTPAVQDLILKGDIIGLRSLMESAQTDGMQTMDQNLFKLYNQNIIDYEEALRQSVSANDLRLRNPALRKKADTPTALRQD